MGVPKIQRGPSTSANVRSNLGTGQGRAIQKGSVSTTKGKANAMPKSDPNVRYGMGGGGTKAPKMTERQDARYDKAHGIKENSASDIKQDKRMGVMGGGGRKNK